MILDAYGRKVDPRDLERRDDSDRSDRWENGWTGIGTQADKTVHGRFFPSERILDQELRSLRDGSDIASRIVEDAAHEMFREGYELTGRIRKERKSGTPTDAADDVLESDCNDLREWAEENFAFDETVLETLIEGRYWGGCLSVMGLQDGGFPWEPLNEDAIRSFDFVSLVDRRYAYVQSQYSGLQAKKYGAAEIYLISNAIAGSGWNDYGAEVRRRSSQELQAKGAHIQFVHESRVIRFDGNRADVQTRQRLAGWSWSVLQRVYDTMRQFEHAFDSVGYLLSDASQAVFKLQGLMKAISAGRRDAIMQRALLMEQTRSVMRGILLDAGGEGGKGEESFTREPTTFTGLPDLLDRFMMRISAAADGMPISRLFGRAPAGLNATGEAETRAWYDSVRKVAQKKVAPKIQRGYRLMSLARNSPMKGKRVDWTATFKPLWSPTDSEVADVRLKKAQASQIYVAEEIIPAEDVALGLKDEYPSLDLEAIEAAKKAKVSFDPHENDEPDPNAGTGEPLSAAAPIPPMGASVSPEQGGRKTPGAATKKAPATPGNAAAAKKAGKAPAKG